MKIPEYEQRVGIDVGIVPVAKAPTAGSGAVLATSLEQIKANQGIAEVGDKFASWGMQQFKLKEEANVADLDTNFRKNLLDKLVSEEIETVTINGKDVQRPKGLMSRYLGQAEGSTVELNSWYRDNKSKYLDSVKSPELRTRLGNTLDNQYLSSLESVIKHESKQGKSVLIEAQVANMDQQIHDAAMINDPAKLQAAIQSVYFTQQNIGNINGDAPDQVIDKQKDRAGDVVSKATTTLLMSSGDLEAAQELLESAKEKIHPDRYEKLSEQIINGYDTLVRKQEKLQVLGYIKNESDYLSRLSKGELSWMNADDVARDVRAGYISENFGNAIVDVLSDSATIGKAAKYDPREKQNQNYPKLIEGIYKAQDQEELNKTLYQILKDHKNLSQDKMGVLISGALERGKNLAGSIRLGDTPANSYQQQDIDAGVSAVLNAGRKSGMTNGEIGNLYQDYYAAIQKGQTPGDAYKSAVKSFAIRDNPQVVTMEEPPTIILDQNNPTRFLLQKSPDNSSPAKYNPATKQIESNPAYKKKRPGKKE